MTCGQRQASWRSTMLRAAFIQVLLSTQIFATQYPSDYDCNSCVPRCIQDDGGGSNRKCYPVYNNCPGECSSGSRVVYRRDPTASCSPSANTCTKCSTLNPPCIKSCPPYSSQYSQCLRTNSQYLSPITSNYKPSCPYNPYSYPNYSYCNPYQAFPSCNTFYSSSSCNNNPCYYNNYPKQYYNPQSVYSINPQCNPPYPPRPNTPKVKLSVVETMEYPEFDKQEFKGIIPQECCRVVPEPCLQEFLKDENLCTGDYKVCPCPKWKIPTYYCVKFFRKPCSGDKGKLSKGGKGKGKKIGKKQKKRKT